MRRKWKKVCAAVLTAAMCTGFSWNVPPVNVTAADAGTVSDTGVSEIPGTTKTESSLNGSFLSVSGFAKGKVNDRSDIKEGTEAYAVVTNEEEFLEAMLGANSGDIKVIEVRADLYLGWFELSQAAKSAGGGIIEAYENSESISATPVANPSLTESGVSTLTMSKVDGLTIFSPNGNTIRHAEFKFNAGVNDLVIRNLEFTDTWEWDDQRTEGFGSTGGMGNRKRTGWTNIKLNGCKNVWIDHCTFGNGFDGNVDIENGSSGITLSWCKIGDDDVSVGSTIYKTAMYLEELYNQNKEDENVSSFRIYKIMRDNGMTVEQIMKYMSQHDKCHLVGAGDKDSWLYKDENGNWVADEEKDNANELLRVSLAYNYYSDIGQRLPMIRSGVGHLYNCYINDWDLAEVNELINSDPKGTGRTIRQQIEDAGLTVVTLTRAIDARDGASIAADTCVYYGCDTPITGTAYHPLGSNISKDYTDTWKYNYALIVNSSVQKLGQTSEEAYTGSSWDNNGDNPFIPDKDYWNETDDKTKDDRKAADAIIGKWSWGQEGLDNDNKLSYEYQTFPLEDVKNNTETYSGFRQIEMSASDWLKTEYSADYEIKAVDHTTEVPIESLMLDKTQATLYMQEEFLQLDARALPYNTTQTPDTYTWESSDTSVAKVSDSGLVIPVSCGSVTITVTSANGMKASCDVFVTNLVTDIQVSGVPSEIYVGDIFKLDVNVFPENVADASYRWEINGTGIELLDAENGIFRATKKGKNVIQVVSNLKGNRVGNDGYWKYVNLSSVKNAKELVTGVSVEPVTQMALGTGGQLRAKVYPENATNKNVVWTVSDSAIAQVAADGTVTAAGVGTTYATVRTVNGGYTTQCAITVTTDAGIVPEPPVTGETVTATIGDVNGDDKITLEDAALTLKIALKLRGLTEQEKKAADVDENGIVDLKDAQRILRAALKLEPFTEKE